MVEVEGGMGEERWQGARDGEEGRTRLSPLSLVMLGGRPAGSACSKIGKSPCRAASYIRVANAMISGDSGVGWTVWSPIGFDCTVFCWKKET